MSKSPSHRRNNLIRRLALGTIAVLMVVLTLMGEAEGTALAVSSPSYPSVLPTGVTHRWNFDEGAGTAIADAVGAADGVLNVETSFWGKTLIDGTAVGKFDPAISTAAGHRVDVSSGITFKGIADDFSIAALVWIDPLSQDGKDRAIAAWWDTSADGWLLRLNAGTSIQFLVQGGAGPTTESISLGVPGVFAHWVPVIVSWNAGVVTLQVGEREVSDTLTVLDDASDVPFRLGWDGRTATDGGKNQRVWEGRMGPVLWWADKALDATERDDTANALWEIAYGSSWPDLSGVTNTDSTPTITKTATPFDGLTIYAPGAFNTPLMSNADFVYVGEVTGTSEYRLARLNKSLVSQETRIFTDMDYDSNYPDHIGVALGVDDDGLIHWTPPGHEESRVDKVTPNANDLTGTIVDEAHNVALDQQYWRYYRNPNTGDFYLVLEAAGTHSIYKWDAVGAEWDIWGGSPVNGSDQPYESTMLFASDGRIYFLWQEKNTGSGYPWRQGGIMLTDDDGTTWKTLVDDRTITMPSHLTPSSSARVRTPDIVFPLTSAAGGASENLDEFHDLTFFTGAVDESDRLVVAAGYRNQLLGRSFQELWVSTYNATGDYWVPKRLMTFAANHIGRINMAVNGNQIAIFVPEYDPR
ncbi:MAG TPA: hypothetical protein VFR55_04880, partial [Dehalococcoidia bacterium]|nr:hypothetical protein [Dehalococcoidia bacterium]